MIRARAGEIRRGERRGRNRLRTNGKETCSLAENAYSKRNYMQIMLTCGEKGVKMTFSPASEWRGFFTLRREVMSEMDLFMTVDDVAKELGISKSYAYKVVQRLNEELKEKGYLTISGRVNRTFFMEKYCYEGGK